MTETKGTGHTPGPWRIKKYSNEIVADNVPKGPMHVADVRGWGYLTGEGHGALGLGHDEAIAIQTANARLIAAAPAMREALEEGINSNLLDELDEYFEGMADAEYVLTQASPVPNREGAFWIALREWRKQIDAALAPTKKDG